MRFLRDYGRKRFLGEICFWTKQYLRQAFVSFNSQFGVDMQQLI